jgi:23S rRNA (uracil1939-C5)-methyltransferase
MIQKLIIKALDHYGRGISKINDKIIFIDNALPDEEVEVEITIEKKNILEGRVVNYLKTSSKRVEPECPYFKSCGGCQIMMLPYDEQLLYKENKVKEVLKKFGNISEELIRPIIPSNQFYYRNKTTLQVNKKIGFYKKFPGLISVFIRHNPMPIIQFQIQQ